MVGSLCATLARVFRSGPAGLDSAPAVCPVCRAPGNCPRFPAACALRDGLSVGVRVPAFARTRKNACTRAELALATASVRSLEGVPAAGSRACVSVSRWCSPCFPWYLCVRGCVVHGCAGSVFRGVPVCGRSLGHSLHSSGLSSALGLSLSVACRKLSSGARTRRTGAERNARRGAPL